MRNNAEIKYKEQQALLAKDKEEVRPAEMSARTTSPSSFQYPVNAACEGWNTKHTLITSVANYFADL